MTTIRYCVGGPVGRPCTAFGLHLEECQSETCRGCYPRQATQGFLCDTCDTYLRQWLDVTGDEPRMGSILWVEWWLGLSEAVRITKAPRWDSGRGTREDLPSPISEAIFDARRELRDRVEAIESAVREKIDHEQPADMPPFRFVAGVRHLASRILRLEDHADLMHAAWEDLSDSLTTAHALAPWRPLPTRLDGIPCPHCERKTLVIEGGDDFATCRTCGCTVISKRFDQWVAMLDHERTTA